MNQYGSPKLVRSEIQSRVEQSEQSRGKDGNNQEWVGYTRIWQSDRIVNYGFQIRELRIGGGKFRGEEIRQGLGENNAKEAKRGSDWRIGGTNWGSVDWEKIDGESTVQERGKGQKGGKYKRKGEEESYGNMRRNLGNIILTILEESRNSNEYQNELLLSITRSIGIKLPGMGKRNIKKRSRTRDYF